MAPTISVILPVYNAENYIADAITSILNQSFTNFELIVINDGSTDKSESIVLQFKDKRIKYFSRENKGLVATLNEAIAKSASDIIARHDADDASDPRRLEVQFELIKKGNILVGSSIKTMDQAGKIINTHRVLSGDTTLKQELLIRSPFAHGSVMFLKEAFYKAGQYDQNDWPAEDYGLWLRMAQFGTIDNAYEALYHYRENESGISSQNTTLQTEKSESIRARAQKTPTLIRFFRRLEQQQDTELQQRQSQNFASILEAAKRDQRHATRAILLSDSMVSPAYCSFILYNKAHKLWRKIKSILSFR